MACRLLEERSLVACRGELESENSTLMVLTKKDGPIGYEMSRDRRINQRIMRREGENIRQISMIFVILTNY